jgi:hypothetical protein
MNLSETFVPIHKTGDNIACIIYLRMSLLSTSYQILTNILFPKLSPYTNVIICIFARTPHVLAEVLFGKFPA